MFTIEIEGELSVLTHEEVDSDYLIDILEKEGIQVHGLYIQNVYESHLED